MPCLAQLVGIAEQTQDLEPGVTSCDTNSFGKRLACWQASFAINEAANEVFVVLFLYFTRRPMLGNFARGGLT